MENAIGDFLRKIVTSTQAGLTKNQEIIDNYPGLQDLIKKASSLNTSLLDEKSARWWLQLFNKFGVPRKVRGEVMGHLHSKIAPRIKQDKTPKKLSDKDLANILLKRLSKESYEIDTDILVEDPVSNYIAKHNKKGLLRRLLGKGLKGLKGEGLANMLDLLSPEKAGEIAKQKLREANNQRIAYMAINMLHKLAQENGWKPNLAKADDMEETEDYLDLQPDTEESPLEPSEEATDLTDAYDQIMRHENQSEDDIYDETTRLASQDEQSKGRLQTVIKQAKELEQFAVRNWDNPGEIVTTLVDIMDELDAVEPSTVHAPLLKISGTILRKLFKKENLDIKTAKLIMKLTDRNKAMLNKMVNAESLESKLGILFGT